MNGGSESHAAAAPHWRRTFHRPRLLPPARPASLITPCHAAKCSSFFTKAIGIRLLCFQQRSTRLKLHVV